MNLGEILVGDNHRSKVDVTTDLQAFALVVTAEPYYAVRQPSNVVVLENVVREDTKGTTEAMHTKYELLERGGYIPTGYKFDPVVLNTKLPLEFFEARNALRIAQSEGAETYASDSYQHAVALDGPGRWRCHQQAHRQKSHDRGRPRSSADRGRCPRHHGQEDRRGAPGERTPGCRRCPGANPGSKPTTLPGRRNRLRLTRPGPNAPELEPSRMHAAQEPRPTLPEPRQTPTSAKSDMANSQAASASALSAAQADADQSRLAAQQAQSSAQQAEADKAAMRARLSEQLNKILQTRDSARGLIVSMSDVLFDTGKYSLKPGAREKLAKVAGILLAYPGLNIEVGGYTDNVGGDQMNQTLSENRAGSVRDYLVQQGVATNAVSAKRLRQHPASGLKR